MIRSVMRSRWVPIALSVVTLFAPLSPFLPTASAKDGDGAPASDETGKRIDELGRVQKALTLQLSRIDPSDFDLAARARSLGPGVDPCFAFVRDEVRIEPYVGMQRGALGTLVARSGNPLDRALLLAELLKGAAGREVRIVHGVLSHEDAARLLDATLQRIAPEGEPDASDPTQAIQAFAKDAGVEPEPLLQGYREMNEAGQKLATDLSSRSKEDVDALRAALAAAGVKLGSAALLSRDEMVSRLQDHYWVQAREGSEGKWQDLDPSFPDAVAGRRVGEAKSQFPADQVPHQSASVVLFRVVIERIVEGKPETVQVLDGEVASADCVGESFAIGLLPGAPSMEAILSAARGTREEKKKLLGDTAVIQPFLQFRGTCNGGRPFNLRGETFDVPRSGALGKGDLGSGAADTLGAMGNALGGAAESKPKDSILSAAWIDWTLRTPGLPERTMRRTLLDRVPAEDRAAGTIKVPDASDAGKLMEVRRRLLREIVASATPGRLGDGFVQWQELRNAGAIVDHLLHLLSARAAGKPPDLGAIAAHGMHGMHPALLQYEAARQREAARIARSTGLLALPDEPSVATFSTGAVAEGEGVAEGFDVLSNPIRYASLKEGGSGGEAAMTQGVTEAQLERLLLPSPDDVVDTSNLFHAARAGGIPMVVLRPEAPGEVKGVETTAAVRARLQAELSDGCVLLVLKRPASVGGRNALAWWRVRPESGQTLGVLEDGSGGATEYEPLVTVGVGMALTLLCFLIAGLDADNLTYKDAIRCALMGVGVGLGLATGNLVGWKMVIALVGWLGTAISMHKGGWLDDTPSPH